MTREPKAGWVMDYETLSNCFTAVFEDVNTEETLIFVVHDLQNDFEGFMEFLAENKQFKERHISFNGLAFDAQITEYCIHNYAKWRVLSGCEIAAKIYAKAQYVINQSNNRDWLDYYESKMRIPQLDLYKLNHWDNPAKRSSLKWVQFSMDWYNLQDMPINHTATITTQAEIDEIIGYNINDVKSTKKILYLSKKSIALRRTLTNEYGINLYSASEPRISKELFLHFLSEKTGVSKKIIKSGQTKRVLIFPKNLILPYVEFKNPVWKELLDKFNNSTIDAMNIKGSFKESVVYHGVKTVLGLGGLHGARKAGLYESGDGMTIMTSDVKSYYPNLAIKNNWSPAHISEEIFCELYAWFYNERIKISKKDIRNYVYKIILNSTYGLSNEKHSFLYDPLFTMQITVNGQLSLMMLYEMIMEGIPGAVPLMQNTDGVETMIPEQYVDKYLQICKEWEDMTSLELDHDEYQKLVLADVNNYIAINKFKEVDESTYNTILKETPHALLKKENSKFFYAATKAKGRFEFHDLPLHKNKSNLASRKAFYNFFVHNTPVEESITSNRNVFDYCIGKKIKGDWNFKMLYVNKGELIQEDLQKTNRYYISKRGAKIIKHHNSDGRKIQVEAGDPMINLFNRYENKPWKEYGINENYYIKAAYKEIANIAKSKTQQLSLF